MHTRQQVFKYKFDYTTFLDSILPISLAWQLAFGTATSLSWIKCFQSRRVVQFTPQSKACCAKRHSIERGSVLPETLIFLHFPFMSASINLHKEFAWWLHYHLETSCHLVFSKGLSSQSRNVLHDLNYL